MFRKGGSAGEGITSGLAPRQGYSTAGDVEQNDLSKIDIRNMNMQQLKDLASQMAYKAPPMPRDTSLRDLKKAEDFTINLYKTELSTDITQKLICLKH